MKLAPFPVAASVVLSKTYMKYLEYWMEYEVEESFGIALDPTI